MESIFNHHKSGQIITAFFLAGPYNFHHRHTHGNGFAFVKLGVPFYQKMEADVILEPPTSRGNRSQLDFEVHDSHVTTGR